MTHGGAGSRSESLRNVLVRGDTDRALTGGLRGAARRSRRGDRRRDDIAPGMTAMLESFTTAIKAA